MAQQDFAALDGANFQALCSLDFSALDDPEEAVVPPDVMAYLIRFFGGMPRALQYVKDRHSIAKAKKRAIDIRHRQKDRHSSPRHRATAKAKAKAKTKQKAKAQEANKKKEQRSRWTEEKRMEEANKKHQQRSEWT